MNVPTTSTALLRVLGEDAQSPRWTEFAARYLPVLEGFLREKYPGVDRDEVIQETLVALVAVLPGYRYAPDEKGHFRNYLIGIVCNKAREWLRAAARRRAVQDELSHLPQETAEPRIEEERAWRHRAYEVALQQLLADPGIQNATKQIFRRVALNGESPDAVAALFGVSRNNVDQIKNRMTQRLRELAKKLEDV